MARIRLVWCDQCKNEGKKKAKGEVDNVKIDMTKNDEGYHERIGNDYLMPVYKIFSVPWCKRDQP